MIFSFAEILDVVIMTLALGVIFAKLLRKSQPIDIQSFKFAVMLVAPAIILHEMGHKFAAIAFGMNAVFHAAYLWLGFGLLLALLNTGVVFFVPAYVSVSGVSYPLAYALIAFAGPFMNLLLWLGGEYMFKRKVLNHRYTSLLFLTIQINKFLFIFNMLPIPGFDGFQVYSSIAKMFF